MRKIHFILVMLLGVIVLSYQNCGRVKFNTKSDKGTVVVDCEAGNNGSATCADKTLYFVGGVAQVFGNSSNADDDSGEIILSHPFNGKNARVKVLVNENGSIEVHPADGYYPWACVDHSQPMDAQLQHTDKEGRPRLDTNGDPILEANCYSPIRWYTDDGQQGFAKDINNIALPIQKNSANDVYRRAHGQNGIYITNMVLLPPDRFNADGSPKNLVWVKNPSPRTDFMMYFTGLYDGVFPYPAGATHLKVYDYKSVIAGNAAWTDLLIENTPQQLSQAAGEGYFP